MLRTLMILLVFCLPLISAQLLVDPPLDRDPNEFCKKCWERRNQKDYYANEFNCTTYYHCFKNGSNIEGILMPCADGLRFEESIPACVPMVFPGRCDDPCSETATMMEGWWQGDQCGIFYQCSNYYSVKMCCPPNHRFNMTWGDCMYDATCLDHNDECGKQSITVPMWTPKRVDDDTCDDVQYGVRRRIVRDDSTKYVVILASDNDDTIRGPRQVTMNCPPATEFDVRTCKCSIHANITELPQFEQCLLDITAFEKNIRDMSHMKFWVDMGRVKTAPNGANNFAIDCPGNTQVEVPGLQGLALGFKLTVAAWIKPECNKNGGIILSNRGEGMGTPASIEFVEQISVVDEDGDGFPDTNVRISIRTVKDTYSETLPLVCQQWNFVAVSYDGMTFTYFIYHAPFGGATEEIKEKQVTNWEELIYWMVHCPLSICENLNDDHEFMGFNGMVDRVRICRHDVTKDELRAMAIAEEAIYDIGDIL